MTNETNAERKTRAFAQADPMYSELMRLWNLFL